MGFQPKVLPYAYEIKTIDSHTMGESTRIVYDGFPYLPGDTMMEKRNILWKNGEFSKEDSAENLADNYASLERGMIYDWCLKGGSYSLREKGKQLFPIYLQSLRKAG